MSTVLAWHFTGDRLRDGRPLPPVGEWLTHEGPITWCESGLYASEHPSDALANAPGAWLHRVEMRRIERRKRDKMVARERRIIASLDATHMLRRYAADEALAVAHLWEMPSVVRQYLESLGDSLRAAAWNAALAAASAAAWEAAWEAAWAAARAAARAAAWEAARDSARAAAWAAARDSAWDAARDAAWDAALNAARAAASDACRQRFAAMVEAAFCDSATILSPSQEPRCAS